MTRRALFVLSPGCEILDLAGPAQVLHEARGTSGVPYTIEYCALTPMVRTAQGLAMSGLGALPVVRSDDWVFVPGYAVWSTKPPPRLTTWLRAAGETGARICSVCIGAFLLGRAGLLDGRRCTTHWRRVGELQAEFPQARVVGDRLFVEDGPIVTSAGIASGIDMTLAMVEEDAGPVVASAVAREMVVYLRRDGAQRQQSVYLDFQTHLSPGVHEVQQYLVRNPATHATIDELAARAQMSPRHLTRVFRRATGVSIQEYRRRLRIEHARMLLRNPTLSLEGIAAACGFADARQLRRLFAAQFGVSPRQFRSNAGVAGAAGPGRRAKR